VVEKVKKRVPSSLVQLEGVKLITKVQICGKKKEEKRYFNTTSTGDSERM
jgi:hypothetical protein